MALQTCETPDSLQALRAPWPVAVKSLRASSTDHRSQCPDDDDRIVRVAHDWYEVGDQVDGEDQVADQEEQPDPNASGEFGIPGKPSNEPNDVRQETQSIADVRRVRFLPTTEVQRHDEGPPAQQERCEHGEHKLPPQTNVPFQSQRSEKATDVGPNGGDDDPWCEHAGSSHTPLTNVLIYRDPRGTARIDSP